MGRITAVRPRSKWLSCTSVVKGCMALLGRACTDVALTHVLEAMDSRQASATGVDGIGVLKAVCRSLKEQLTREEGSSSGGASDIMVSCRPAGMDSKMPLLASSLVWLMHTVVGSTPYGGVCGTGMHLQCIMQSYRSVSMLLLPAPSGSLHE